MDILLEQVDRCLEAKGMDMNQLLGRMNVTRDNWSHIKLRHSIPKRVLGAMVRELPEVEFHVSQYLIRSMANNPREVE